MTAGGRGEEANLCAATINNRKNVGLRRVELQLNRKFLRVYGIRDVFAFQKLMEILLRRHFHFATLNGPKVLQHLRNAGRDPPEMFLADRNFINTPL